MTKKRQTPEERCLIAAANSALEKGNIDKARLADAAGISQVLLTRVLNGASRMSAGTWKKICAGLELDYEEILQKTSTALRDAKAVLEGIPEEPPVDPAKLQKQIEEWPSVVSNEPKPVGVLVPAPQEELYRLFLFCEERMADSLRMGIWMAPEQLHKLLTAMYALRDASLAMQEGETY